MLENIWKFTGRLSAFTLFLGLIFFLSGCSHKHQKIKSENGFEYYPDGVNTIPSKKSSTYNPYRKKSSKNYKSKKVGKKDGSAAMHRATLRPYKTFGITYYPKIEPIGEELVGIASWYGPKFHGRKTSNGEVYDMHGMTAAHKTLPMNTIVEVTHRKTGRKTKVRINDRGPFVKGRIIDLSFEAGKFLGLDKTGVAPVKLKVISYDKYISSYQGGVKVKKSSQKYGVQLASFSDKENGEKLQHSSEIRFNRTVKLHSVQKGSETLYKVVVPEFSSRKKAEKFIDRHMLKNVVIVKQ